MFQDIPERSFVLSRSAGSNDNPIGLLTSDILREKIPALFSTQKGMHLRIRNIIEAGSIP
jgi:hypothetical protein